MMRWMRAERVAKRRKEYIPPPTLPEISELGGGDIQNWEPGMGRWVVQ